MSKLILSVTLIGCLTFLYTQGSDSVKQCEELNKDNPVLLKQCPNLEN